MKYILQTLLFFSFSLLFSQKYDNNWVLGFPPYSVINFEQGTVDSIHSFNYNQFLLSSSTVSSYTGELLYFSDGIEVRDKNGNTIEHGNEFLFGHEDSVNYFPGEAYLQGALLLPMPESDSLYYYFHMATVGNQVYQANRLFYSIIDATANSSGGSVISQNNLLIDTFITDAMMGLCKHANGKDWWLLKPKFSSNTFFRFLIRANGVIEGPFIQNIGITFKDPDWKGQMVFTVNGDKMVTGTGLGPSELFDFDRCTGLLSNSKYFSAIDGSYIVGAIGCSFSANGRYIYATMDSFKLYQLDTYSTNIDSSKFLLIRNPPAAFHRLFYHQLTPEGEIYIAGHGAPTPISVIHYPDSAGLACGLDTFSFNPFYGNITFGMPCFPHYRTPTCAAYAADAGRDTTVCDSLLNLSVGIALGKPTVDSVVYNWSSPNDLSFGGSTQAQVILHPAHTATYILHIQDTCTHPTYSCTERWDTVTITVTNNCNPTASPQTPVGGLKDRIQIMPNPAHDYVNVVIDKNMSGSMLTVTDVTGRVVLVVYLNTQYSQLNTSRFAKGIYFVTVKNKDGEWKEKLVVE